MNKKKLSPFDHDLCAMIESITGEQVDTSLYEDLILLSWKQNGICGKDDQEARKIKALKQAITGRLGDRFIEFTYSNMKQYVSMKYDPTEYPEEARTRLTEPDMTVGMKYQRKFMEIDAIQLNRDNVEDVIKFTGGGTITRMMSRSVKVSFLDRNGIFVDIPEGWYVIRDLKGKFYVKSENEFNREFEQKKEAGSDPKDAPDLISLFNELYGTDLIYRSWKMDEEFNEYKEALNNYVVKNNDKKSREDVIDELADLHSIVIHSASILGVPARELIERTYDKVTKRQIDPDYKREHSHDGGCFNFNYEDASGNGYCTLSGKELNCGNSSCKNYDSRK